MKTRFLARFGYGVLLGLSVSSLIAALSSANSESLDAQVSEVEVFTAPFGGCSGGRMVRVTLPDPMATDSPTVEVFPTVPPRTHAAVLSAFRSAGATPKLLMNAGFFYNNKPVSFFSSALNRDAGGFMYHLPARSCMRFAKGQTPEIFLGTEAAISSAERLRDAEIFCGGPRLIAGSVSVVEKQFCAEGFHPKCRADGQDSGLGYSARTPRAATCIHSSGAVRFYTFDSPTRKCGPTLPELTEILRREGCVDALNLDGGGSVKLFASTKKGLNQTLVRGASADHTRPIPIWILVR